MQFARGEIRERYDEANPWRRPSAKFIFHRAHSSSRFLLPLRSIWFIRPSRNAKKRRNQRASRMNYAAGARGLWLVSVFRFRHTAAGSCRESRAFSACYLLLIASRDGRFPFRRLDLLLMYRTTSGELGAAPSYVDSWPYARVPRELAVGGWFYSRRTFDGLPARITPNEFRVLELSRPEGLNR
jgi:hypothetical protein